MKQFRLILLLTAATCFAALPEPPGQHNAWTPPASNVLPDYVIRRAGEFFDAGFPDPRGGEYHEVSIGKIQTHAWVFPGGFAVAWNGLVYRIAAVGAPADLDRDVRIIVELEPWRARLFMRPYPNPPDAAFWYDMERGQTMAPASIALLLRLGGVDLAEKIWQAPESDGGTSHVGLGGLWTPEALLAWYGTAYWRLVGAFSNADDHEAVDVAESLLQWQSPFPAEWPEFAFLRHVPVLLADSRRRLQEPAHRPKNRIDGLIDRLEDVRGTTVTIPGDLIVQFDAIYRALKKEGKAAVQPLLDDDKHDQRLTRTCYASRPQLTDCTPIPVHQVIQSLLADIRRR